MASKGTVITRVLLLSPHPVALPLAVAQPVTQRSSLPATAGTGSQRPTHLPQLVLQPDLAHLGTRPHLLPARVVVFPADVRVAGVLHQPNEGLHAGGGGLVDGVEVTLRGGEGRERRSELTGWFGLGDCEWKGRAYPGAVGLRSILSSASTTLAVTWYCLPCLNSSRWM